MKRVSVFRRYASALCIPQLPIAASSAEIIPESLLLPPDAYQILRQPIRLPSSLPGKTLTPESVPHRRCLVGSTWPQKGTPFQGYDTV